MCVLPRPLACRVALGLLVLIVQAPAWAADPIAEYKAIKRASLKGLESIEVVVPPAKMDPGCRHVSAEELQAEVEDRLKQAGIRIDPDPGTATYLVITVTSIAPLKDVLCGFPVTVGLQQVVLLVRDTRIMTFGMTWQHTGLGVAAPVRVPEHLRHMLAHTVDEFFSVCLEEKPRP